MSTVTRPCLYGPGINRLADLLGAGGSHCALGLVEVHTSLFERQTAEIQNPADLRLQIRDDLFILYV